MNSGWIWVLYSQDLVVPVMQPPANIFLKSPLLGNTPQKRSMLAFFRGSFREKEPRYSRGIRQTLHQLARSEDWKQQYNIYIGTSDEIPGDYSQLLSSSVFCLVLPGMLLSTVSHFLSNIDLQCKFTFPIYCTSLSKRYGVSFSRLLA